MPKESGFGIQSNINPGTGLSRSSRAWSHIGPGVSAHAPPGFGEKQTREDQLSAEIRGVLLVVESHYLVWSEGFDLAEMAGRVDDKGDTAKDEHLP